MSDWLRPRIERRLHDRRRETKSARILIEGHSGRTDCIVRDLSETGAKLAFPTPCSLPKKFRLLINETGTFDCEIARVSGLDYGVKFLGLQPLSDAAPGRQRHNVTITG